MRSHRGAGRVSHLSIENVSPAGFATTPDRTTTRTRRLGLVPTRLTDALRTHVLVVRGSPWRCGACWNASRAWRRARTGRRASPRRPPRRPPRRSRGRSPPRAVRPCVAIVVERVGDGAPRARGRLAASRPSPRTDTGSRAGRFRRHPLAGRTYATGKGAGGLDAAVDAAADADAADGLAFRRTPAGGRRPGLDARLRGRTRVPLDGREDRRDGDAPGASSTCLCA